MAKRELDFVDSSPLTPKRSKTEQKEQYTEAEAEHPLTPSNNISPIKNNRFLGEIVDSTSSIRLVKFDQDMQQKLAKMKKENTPNHLSNCEVQFNLYTKSLEVVVKKYTKIEESSIDFSDVPDTSTIGSSPSCVI